MPGGPWITNGVIDSGFVVVLLLLLSSMFEDLAPVVEVVGHHDAPEKEREEEPSHRVRRVIGLPQKRDLLERRVDRDQDGGEEADPHDHELEGADTEHSDVSAKL